MPKMKTCKAAAKRLKVTARGKFKRHRAGAGHLKSRKNAKRLRGLRKATLVSHAFAKHARHMLGL
ncbi:MAG TPA: 50S ribosomal protein L35 [Phycisphaerae bacterium]|nr:50S ribosomal protein L35 [Phycisphaerae bacterium]